MNKYWFKPKKYGYGVYPVSWEGFLANLFFVAILLLSAYSNGILENTEFIFDIIISTALFLLLCKNKTDGELKWRWGNK